jgi:glycerol-3-phosphate dehydrogenase subunit C
MTTTYDPRHVAYLDEADVRQELTRVFDVCGSCRKCVDLCTSFPSLFEFIDRHDDRDAGRLTPAQQDQVVDECHHCKLCVVGCPYAPQVHEQAVDVPRLMLRAVAMQHSTKQVGVRSRVTTELVGRADLVGKVATRVAPAVNRIVEAGSGSFVRKALERATGLSSVRLLPPFTRQRFTTWFERRPRVRINKRQGRVAVFPTCLVEYHRPDIGHDLVKVYERNGIECSLADGVGCCGAPWLHNGDVDAFRKVASKNLAALAKLVKQGKDVVVPQPACSYVIKRDYVDHLPGPDAASVAERTYDAAEYLMKVHRGETTTLDTDFGAGVPETVTYHVPCHLRAQQVGLRSRDLIRLTGSRVRVVQQCSGMEGGWGARAEHAELAQPLAVRLGDEIRRAGGDAVAGDCHLANTVIAEQTGESPLHPIQLLARAYGIPPEPAR